MVILRPASLSAQPTARWYTGFAVAQHQRNDAGDAAVVDIGIEHRVHARQSLDREAIAQRVGLRRQRGAQR